MPKPASGASDSVSPIGRAAHSLIAKLFNSAKRKGSLPCEKPSFTVQKAIFHHTINGFSRREKPPFSKIKIINILQNWIFGSYK